MSAMPGWDAPAAAGLDGLPWFAPLWQYTEVATLRSAPHAAAMSAALDADERLLPTIVADVIVPVLTELIQRGYDACGASQTAALAARVAEVHLYDLPPECCASLVGAVASALLAAAQACVVPVVVVAEASAGQCTAYAVARAAALRHCCRVWMEACGEVPGMAAAVGGCVAALTVATAAVRDWVAGRADDETGGEDDGGCLAAVVHALT